MIAVHYTSIKPTETKGRVYGVDVAVRDWLRGWFRYGAAEKFNFLIGEAKEWDEVQEIARQEGVDPSRLAGLDRRYVRENLAQFKTVFRPNPDSHNLLWQREQLPPPGFAFCGLAHAIAGAEAGKLLEQYCLAPGDAADAIICPSQAVKSAIRNFWDIYGGTIERRFGAPFRCEVQLPVIPLGIDVGKFEQRATPEKRAAQRAALGLGDNDIALLWVGRLSSAIKAHPLAMFQAAERAAELTGAKVHLLMLGYFMPEEAEAQFKKLAADFCKKAQVTFIASDDARFPDGLWAAGDIFLSLIDNVQESFGLTPIEAMAAGLPRVISDWDGYRDSVKHGEDGFLVPTTQPPAGAGEDLSRQLLNGREMYGTFLAKAALSVAVDAEAAAESLAALIRDKNLRASMAAKAHRRAREVYDWKHIVPAYEKLWAELAERRAALKARAKPANWPTLLPQAPDPFAMYAAYPSAALKETDRLSVIASPEDIRLLWRHEINVLGLDVMLPPEEMTKLVNHIAGAGGIAIAELFTAFPAHDRARLWRAVGWLLKLGIVRRIS